MPSMTVFQFLRGRKRAYGYWKERCQRKDTELAIASEKAYIRGTEESRQAYLARLREAERDYIIDVEQSWKDAEDIKALREQNEKWCSDAGRKLAKIQGKIERMQRIRIIDGHNHGNNHHRVIEVRL